MAFTTSDQILAALPGQVFFIEKSGAASNSWSTWFQGNTPAAAPTSPGNTTTGVVPNAGDTGTLPIRAASGSNNLYLARYWVASTGGQNTVWLADRLWHAGSISLASAATTTFTPTAITRPSGATDAELWLEMNATCSTSAVVTCSYTNQAGVAGQTADHVGSPIAAAAGNLVQMHLQSGDTGVQSVQSITVTNATSGGINVVLLRRLHMAVAQGACCYFDPRTSFEMTLTKIYSTSALFLLGNPSAGGVAWTAMVQIIEG